MSNQCLVTKLKSVVNNPNLPYIGEMIFDVNLNTSQEYLPGLNFTGIDGNVITGEIIGDGTFLNADKQPIGKTADLASTKYLGNGTYKVRIKSKYDIISILAQYGKAVAFNNITDVNDLLRYSPIISFAPNAMFGGDNASLDVAKFFYEHPTLVDVSVNGSNLNVQSEFTKNIGRKVGVNFTSNKSASITGDINTAFQDGLISGSYLRDSSMTGNWNTLFDVWATKPSLKNKNYTLYTNGLTTLNGEATTRGGKIVVHIGDGTWNLVS